MNKKLQVFISSTFTDLIEERQAAVETVLDAGHIPAGMELFKAGKSQIKTIRKWIDESDVYILILGGRYGSIEKESGLSYTELEYKYALSKNMPVFAIILEDNFLFTKAASKVEDVIFEKDNIAKYEKFKEFVKTNVVRFVDNSDKIASVIHSHLNHILTDSDYHLNGWIRNTTKQNEKIDFKTLSTVFSKITILEQNDIKKNANVFFLDNIPYFNIGVSESFQAYTYFHYSKIYLLYGLLEKVKNENNKDMLQLSKLGSEYCAYLVTNVLFT